jgi:hypothetical protein
VSAVFLRKQILGFMNNILGEIDDCGKERNGPCSAIHGKGGKDFSTLVF